MVILLVNRRAHPAFTPTTNGSNPDRQISQKDQSDGDGVDRILSLAFATGLAPK